jgi:hypothetical protein
MPSTRSSARLQGSSPSKSSDHSPQGKTGTKRKAAEGSSHPSKREKKTVLQSDQKTIEETMPIAEQDNQKDIEMEAAQEGDASVEDGESPATDTDGKTNKVNGKHDEEANADENRKGLCHDRQR